MLRIMATADNTDNVGVSVRDLIKQSWYAYEDASVVVQPVALSSMRPIARSVQRDRLQRAASLVREFRATALEPYVPVLDEGPEGVCFISPPIVERHASLYHVVDGMHRLVAAREWGLTSVLTLVVETANLPPPTLAPCKWSDVKIVDHLETREEKFPGFVPNLFRPTARILDDMSGPYVDESALFLALKRSLGR